MWKQIQIFINIVKSICILPGKECIIAGRKNKDPPGWRINGDERELLWIHLCLTANCYLMDIYRVRKSLSTKKNVHFKVLVIFEETEQEASDRDIEQATIQDMSDEFLLQHELDYYLNSI